MAFLWLFEVILGAIGVRLLSVCLSGEMPRALGLLLAWQMLQLHPALPSVCFGSRLQSCELQGLFQGKILEQLQCRTVGCNQVMSK